MKVSTLIPTFVLFWIVLASPPRRVQEKAVVVKPEVVTVDRTVKEFEIASITFRRLPAWQLTIEYTDNLGAAQIDNHIGVTSEINPTGADTLIASFNKANLSVKSMERRAIEHLISEGKIPESTVVGTPR